MNDNDVVMSTYGMMEYNPNLQCVFNGLYRWIFDRTEFWNHTKTGDYVQIALFNATGAKGQAQFDLRALRSVGIENINAQAESGQLMKYWLHDTAYDANTATLAAYSVLYILSTSICNCTRKVKSGYEDQRVTCNRRIASAFAGKDISNMVVPQEKVVEQIRNGKLPAFELHCDNGKHIVKATTLSLKNCSITPFQVMCLYIYTLWGVLTGNNTAISTINSDAKLLVPKIDQTSFSNQAYWNGYSSMIRLPCRINGQRGIKELCIYDISGVNAA